MVRGNLPFTRNKRPETLILVFVLDKILSNAYDVICECWMEIRLFTFIVYYVMQ